MLELLNSWDRELFLFINSFHNGFWDFIMYWLSERNTWIPLYIFLTYLIIRYYKKQAYLIIIFAILCAVVTETSSYHLFKLVFQRLRPCHDPSLDGLVYILNGKCGGDYGFVSAHAANTFGLAVYTTIFLGKKIKYLTPLMFIWTISISYSRIYLGVHYPGDVICGAILGAVCGYIFSLLCKKLLR